MAAPLFFVPLAVAGGKVFFKFATKKAAQAFKGRFAKAGNVTTRTPPKSATVTTTGSNKGKSIINDMTKPVTKPTISPRNPNTKTLPKAPASKSGVGTAATAGTAAVGVATGAKTAGQKDKSKSSSMSVAEAKRKIARAEAREKRLQADSKRAKAAATPSRTPMKNVGGKGPSRTLADKIATEDTNIKLKQDKAKKGASSAKAKTMDEARRNATAKRKAATPANKKRVTSDMARKSAMKSYKRKPDKKRMTSDAARRQAMRGKK